MCDEVSSWKISLFVSHYISSFPVMFVFSQCQVGGPVCHSSCWINDNKGPLGIVGRFEIDNG